MKLRHSLTRILVKMRIILGLATSIMLISSCELPLKPHRNATATFKCRACGIEFKKCSSCDVPPEDHQNVNHLPIHKGCKGIGEVIYK